MTASRTYVDTIVNTSKHGDKGLLGAVASQRAFDSADYNSTPEIKAKRDEHLKAVNEAFLKIKIPPKTEQERKMMITEMHACFHKIGNEIINELKVAMKSEPGFNLTDEQLQTQATEAARNYLFNFIPELNVKLGIPKSTEVFLNDLTLYSHKDNPLVEFDKLYKERLIGKCNNLVIATNYMEMVNNDYFKDVLKSNQDTIWTPFNNIIVTTNVKEEKNRLNTYKSTNQKTLDQLKVIKAIDDKIYDCEDKITSLNKEIKNGYTSLISQRDRLQNEVLLELKAERVNEIDALKKINKSVTVVDINKSIHASDVALKDSINKLAALDKVTKLKSLVKDSKVDVKAAAKANDKNHNHTNQAIKNNILNSIRSFKQKINLFFKPKVPKVKPSEEIITTKESPRHNKN